MIGYDSLAWLRYLMLRQSSCAGASRVVVSSYWACLVCLWQSSCHCYVGLSLVKSGLGSQVMAYKSSRVRPVEIG